MAWNGRVVKTYGRHKRRTIKNEAWISPDLKPTATNVFSSPDTDVSVSSANGSVDAISSSGSTNGRPAKQLGRGSQILASSPLVEFNKENAIATLAPETPEEEQGRRRRAAVRNARKITRNKKMENTPKLFSSDSEDGLRKAVGRKALSVKSNMMEPRKRNTEKQTAQSRRVKNIIENNTYTIIRSPPPRCQRSSKRFKSSRLSRQISAAEPNLSMSPFEMLASWIDVVAATSTPMVELVKLDSNDKRIQGNSLLEDSLSKGNQEQQQCSKNQTCREGCKCKTCEDADNVAGKLFELTLSGEEDEEANGEGSKPKEQKNMQGRILRRKKLVNYKEDTLDDVKSNGKRKQQRKTKQHQNKSEESNSSSNSSFLGSSASSKGFSSVNSDCSGESARVTDSKLNMSECSVSLEPLSRVLEKLHIESTVCDVVKDKESRCARVTRGKSQEEEKSDEEFVLNSRKLRTSEQSNGEGPFPYSTRIRTRGQSRTEANKAESEEEEEREFPIRRMRTRGQSGSQYREEERGNEEEYRVKSTTRRVRTNGHSCEEENEDDNRTKPRRKPMKGQSKDCAEESEEDAEASRLQTDGQSTEDDEPECPVTPMKKHLASFRTDSFKEVFTPKKHNDTGLPVTSREKVLQQCEQTQPISFTECISPAMLTKCVKIGEGVYGEVFRAVNSKRQSVALKIIPIEGDFEVNEEPQKTFEEILPEIVISRELSYLSEGDSNYCCNYIGVNNVSCVQGCYPEVLLKEWDSFDSRKESENDRPDIFDEEQLYIVFEFADGGQDLEGFEFENLQQAVSVLQQVAFALAVAEEELDFEHRDLHWGNVLIRPIKHDHVAFRLGNENYSVMSYGLEAGIIDFTLSRLQKEECTIFCDLAADPTLFDGTGDYQFQIYRKMKKENENNWEPFMPHTNVLWLHYLTDKIINKKTYQNPTSKAHKATLSNLRSFYRHLLSHSSAEEVVMESDLLDL